MASRASPNGTKCKPRTSCTACTTQTRNESFTLSKTPFLAPTGNGLQALRLRLLRLEAKSRSDHGWWAQAGWPVLRVLEPAWSVSPQQSQVLNLPNPRRSSNIEEHAAGKNIFSSARRIVLKSLHGIQRPTDARGTLLFLVRHCNIGILQPPAGLLLPQGYENATGSLTVLPAHVFQSSGMRLLVSLAIWSSPTPPATAAKAAPVKCAIRAFGSGAKRRQAQSVLRHRRLWTHSDVRPGGTHSSFAFLHSFFIRLI